jgi:molecular chaperone GrpE
MQNSRATEETGETGTAPQEERSGEHSELDELRERNAELEDRYKRALADLDNYRKRSVRDIDRRVAENRESLVRDWLDAVDAVERAVRMAPENPMAEGLRSVLDQMEAILERQGAERIGRGGEQFDPTRHEAVGVRETDEVPDRTVLEVVRSGFAMGDRVVRPAEVIVSRSGGRDG